MSRKKKNDENLNVFYEAIPGKFDLSSKLNIAFADDTMGCNREGNFADDLITTE